MKLSVLRSKKGAHPIMGVVFGAVVLFIGIYATMMIINSITLPTNTYSESLTFVNGTAKAVSYPYINSLSSIANATHTFPANDAVTPGKAYYTYTQNDITVNTNGTYAALTWTASYTYNLKEGNVTYGTTQTTFWNSMQLGAVSLITLAASLVLGSFFFS